MGKKMVSLLLALVMVMAIVPVTALAATDSELTVNAGEPVTINLAPDGAARVARAEISCEALELNANLGFERTYSTTISEYGTYVFTVTYRIFGNVVATETVTVNVLCAHDLAHHDAKAATCTEDGNVAYDFCTVCQMYFTEKHPEGFTEAQLNNDYFDYIGIEKTGEHTMLKTDGWDATCTADGYKAYYRCESCNGRFFDEAGKQPVGDNPDYSIPALGHKMTQMDGWDATCTVGGMKPYYRCENCQGRFFDEAGQEPVGDNPDYSIPALGHKMVKTDGWDATCTADGYKDYYRCENCNGRFFDEAGEQPVGDNPDYKIPALGHKMTMVDGWDATCTTDGYKAYYRCENCNGRFFDEAGEQPVGDNPDYKIPALGHKMNLVDGWDASCTTDGYKPYYHCENCHGRFFDEAGEQPVGDNPDYKIPALGHDTTKVDGWDATCTTNGVKDYYLCKRCFGRFFDEKGQEPVGDNPDYTIPALGHKYGDDDICEQCGEKKPGDAHEHTLKHMDGVPANCSQDGWIEYSYCTVCYQRFKDAEGKIPVELDELMLPATGHSIKHMGGAEANCTQDGWDEYYYCEVCYQLFKDVEGKIPASLDELMKPATGHTLKHMDGVMPSCTQDGWDEYYYCQVCYKLFKDEAGEVPTTAEELLIPATGHLDIGYAESSTPTCTDDGNVAYNYCAACETFFTEEHPEGFSHADYAAHPEYIFIPALGHDMKQVDDHYECRRCGNWYADAEGEGEYEKPDGCTHKVEFHPEAPATCCKSGRQAYYFCNTCKLLFLDAEKNQPTTWKALEIPATGVHTLEYRSATDTTVEYWICTECGKKFADAAGSDPLDDISKPEENGKLPYEDLIHSVKEDINVGDLNLSTKGKKDQP